MTLLTTENTKDEQLDAYKKFFDAVFEEIYNPCTPFNTKINSLMFQLDVKLTKIHSESTKGEIL